MSKIKSITPDGNFEYRSGPMAGKTAYCFKYEFEDGQFGTANHLTESSPFTVGDEVEVTVTGEHNGVSKLKVQKPREDGAPSRPPAQRQYTPKTAHKPTGGADDDFIPQTLCHFIGAAAELARTDPQSDGTITPTLVANYACILYEARELAVAQLRGKH